MQRAQIVLDCEAGESTAAIAKRMGLTGMAVGKWRKRYLDLGLEGLHDEFRSGRPQTYADDQGGRSDQPGSTDQSPPMEHPLEGPLTFYHHRHLGEQSPPLAADLFGPTPPSEIVPFC